MKILKILSVLLIPILTACPDPSVPEPPQPRETALPAMSYIGRTVSRGGRSAQRTISVDITGGLTAADVDFAFDPPSSKPSWLNISSTGTIGGTVPADASAGSTTYTIKVTGKGVYLGKTQNVPFTLTITTDACIDALSVSCDQFAEAYLKASNTDAGDQFGYSVSLSGDTLAVGARYEGSNATGVGGSQSNNGAGGSGAVYVFTRSGTTWSQQAYLKASNTDAGDQFGYSVSLSGDTLAVGAHDEDSNVTGIGGSQSNNGASGSGAVYVFTRSGTTWSRQAYLKASNTGTGDRFGWSVSLFGDTLAVGAHDEDSNATGIGGSQSNNGANGSGAVYVFTRSGTAWSQQAYLKASNTDAIDLFGYSVSLFGDTLAVGAYGEDSNARGVGGIQNNNGAGNSGAVYVFTRSGTAWSQQAYLKASNTDAGDQFGWSVSLSGDTLAVGALWENGNATGVNGNQNNNRAANSGAVYVFTRSGTAWSQEAYLKASNTDVLDQFGHSISLSGDTLAVGARYEDSNATGIGGSQSNNGANGSGAVYVFTRSGTAWSRQAYLKASNTDAGDQFGYSVSLSGDRLAVGAHDEDSNATGVGGSQSNNGSSGSGAVYVRRIAP